MIKALFLMLLVLQTVGMASVQTSYEPMPSCWPCKTR
jgi:hypothetical protein